MSGSGGSGGGGGDGINDCASLHFNTTLNSPDPDVISDLSEGDVLEVKRPDPDNRRVVAVTEDDRTAGSITSSQQTNLVACMESGVTFIARVVKVNGGACDIEVRPEST